MFGVFLLGMGRPAFFLWGRFADRPLAGSGRSSALAAVPRRAERSHPHARVGHRQALIPKKPEQKSVRVFSFMDQWISA